MSSRRRAPGRSVSAKQRAPAAPAALAAPAFPSLDIRSEAPRERAAYSAAHRVAGLINEMLETLPPEGAQQWADLRAAAAESRAAVDAYIASLPRHIRRACAARDREHIKRAVKRALARRA